MEKQRSLSRLFLFLVVVALSGVLAASALNADEDRGKSGPLPAVYLDAHALVQIALHANIETIGVIASGPNLPETGQLKYRKSGEVNWHTGHPLLRIDDGRLVGSLFGLSPSTTYDVRVIVDSNELSESITTKPDELQFNPSKVIHVDQAAPPGGDGSETAPFQTIQEGVSSASSGARVLVSDGVYHEKVTFSSSGIEGNWIQVIAKDSGAILDGSEHYAGDIWAPYGSEQNVWFTNVGSPAEHLTRDGRRFYRYENLDGLVNGIGYHNVPISEGWYIDPDTSVLYVRSHDDPTDHTWQIPRFNHAFDVDSRDWLWIEGFEIRYYGKEDGRGFYLENTSHVVIRNNKIHGIPEGIKIFWTGGDDRGNDTRVEYNEISDPPVSEWPWEAVKNTPMEGAAIVVGGRQGAIVRGNSIYNIFNGVFTGQFNDLENTLIAFDTDIYDNMISNIGDDALEAEGACVNNRFRNNVFDAGLVGISLAPITFGPTWILHSEFTNFDGTSIKWDEGSDGLALIYHNTFWTDVENQNALTIKGRVHNSVMRNNIFRGTRYAFEAEETGNTGHDWDYDNWHTTGQIEPKFKWEGVDYDDIGELCAAIGLECNGHDKNPGLANPNNGDFTLLSSSPNIDRGVVIPGINDDYFGSAPDIGAYEFDPTLVLYGTPGNHSIHLTWTVEKTLPENSTWEISYEGPTGDQPSPIVGIPSAERDYLLTGIENGVPYAITLSAVVDNIIILSDSIIVIPAKRLFLPVIKRSSSLAYEFVE